jgi:hypothetical protein
MAHKIHQRTAKTPPPKPDPRAPQENPPPSVPAPSGPDSFIQGLAAAVYRNHPLVMLCTQPQFRELTSRIPVVRDVADTFCPVVTGTDKADVKK